MERNILKYVVFGGLINYIKIANAFNREVYSNGNVRFPREGGNILVGLKMGDRLEYNSGRNQLGGNIAFDGNAFDRVVPGYNTVFQPTESTTTYYLYNQRKSFSERNFMNEYYQKQTQTDPPVKDLLDAIYSKKDKTSNPLYSNNFHNNNKRNVGLSENDVPAAIDKALRPQFSKNNENREMSFINRKEEYAAPQTPFTGLRMSMEKDTSYTGPRVPKERSNTFRQLIEHRRSNMDPMDQRYAPINRDPNDGDQVIEVKLRNSLNIQNLNSKLIIDPKIRKSKDLNYPHETFHMKIKIVDEPENIDRSFLRYPRNKIELVDDMNYSEFKDLLELARKKKEAQKHKVLYTTYKPRYNDRLSSTETDFLQ